MQVNRLRIDGVRNLHAVDIEPATGLNMIVGPNGAGKTSILEALYALSTGRSFRGGRAPFVNHAAGVATIFSEIERGRQSHRLGLERRGSGWQARVDGEPVKTLGELAQQLAVLVFHPGLHALVEGSSGVRRKFLDFGVFHVEQNFLGHWRTYARALKQRNAGLKQNGPTEGWESAMAQAAIPLTEARYEYVDELHPAFSAILGRLSLDLIGIELSLKRGWGDGDLAARLAQQRQHDQTTGITRAGPHRADLEFRDALGVVAGRLSRGQQKLVALALVLAQARVMRNRLGEAPIVALDDLASELDSTHRELALGLLRDMDAQIWVSGTDEVDTQAKVFHVEHGRVSDQG